MAGNFENLILTDAFLSSLASAELALGDEERAGILLAVDDLEANPGVIHNRLHRLDRELTGWWSITPPVPNRSEIRILVRPERTGSKGIWRIGPVTRHYRR